MKKLHKVLTNRSGTNQLELAEIVAAEHIVELVKLLNRTRDNYDARIRTIDAKLDIIFERLNFQSVSAKKPTFSPRPKLFKDLPAFLLRDISLYFLRQICWSLLA